MTTTSEPRFGLDDVLTAMRKAVEDRGKDYLYDNERGVNDAGCYYSKPDGTPSCLVGYVINALDHVEFVNVAEREVDRDESEQSNHLRGEWIPKNFWSDEADEALYAAQRYQDTGETWGYALAAAENLGADAD